MQVVTVLEDVNAEVATGRYMNSVGRAQVNSCPHHFLTSSRAIAASFTANAVNSHQLGIWALIARDTQPVPDFVVKS
jgi:hypothetical protein